MTLKIRFELYRWFYFILIWFFSMGLGFVIIEIAVGPAFQWWLHDKPYELPTMNRAVRTVLVVLLITFIAGTISWYHEKRISGR